MRTKLNIKQSIQSSFANISTKVPAVCSGVSISFQTQAREHTALHDNQNLEELPNLTKLQFLFNDNLNQSVAYQIDERGEALMRYVESLSLSEKDSVNINNVNSNNSYGLGYNFGAAVNLQNQKFTVQFESGIDNTTPFLVYLYFHSFYKM